MHIPEDSHVISRNM